MDAEIIAAPPIEQSDANRLRRLAVVSTSAALLGLAYWLAGLVGLRFRLPHAQVSIIWPANAVLLAAFLLTPRSRWWIAVLATAVAHFAVMSGSVPMWRGAWQIAANTLFAGATAMVLLRYTRLPLDFESRRQVAIYAAVSILLPAAYGFITPGFILATLRLEPAYTPSDALQRTLLANATSLLIVAPFLLLCGEHVRNLRRPSASRVAEAAAIAITLGAVSLVAFGTEPTIPREAWLLIGLFPPLLWAAVRFGPLGAVTALFAVAAVSVWGTSRHLGPFVLIDQAKQVVSLQLLWIGLYFPVMLLAASVREREIADEAVRAHRNQLAHITRVRTVAELSSAFVHELRQPLTAILANAQAARHLLSRQPADVDEVQQILRDIESQDQQAARVLERLREFIKPDAPLRREPVTVESIVRDSLALARTTFTAAGVTTHVRVEPGLPTVSGDVVQLLQVVVNLLVNACEATQNVATSERRVWLSAGRRGDNHVAIAVADNGEGLPRGGEDRVFEPFFTTKERGLGLGLAIGRSIVSSHGGELLAENQPHGGAVFHMLLPIAFSQRERVAAAAGE